MKVSSKRLRVESSRGASRPPFGDPFAEAYVDPTVFFKQCFYSKYAGHCHDRLGGAWITFGGCAHGASGFVC